MNGKNGVGVTKPDTGRKWREVGIKMQPCRGLPLIKKLQDGHSVTVEGTSNRVQNRRLLNQLPTDAAKRIAHFQFSLRQLIVKSYKFAFKQVFRQWTGYLVTIRIVNQLHQFQFLSLEKRVFVVVPI